MHSQKRYSEMVGDTHLGCKVSAQSAAVSVKTEVTTTKKVSLDDKHTRRSAGIACFGLFSHNGVTTLKVLLGTKRCSYAFSELAQGKYIGGKREIMKKLDQMYLDDKLVVCSGVFDMIWYRVWLNFSKPSSYYVAKNKFETTFLTDGGVSLRKMISKSRNKPRVWEIPKGRKRSKNEAEINCAIREFHEETGISPSGYKLYPEFTRTCSFSDNGITYTNTYYLAFTRNPIQPDIKMSNKEQCDELTELKWMDLNEIRLVDLDGRLEKVIKPMMNYLKNRFRE